MSSCKECERPSNNKYFNCPPRMSDGRHFTDYRPRCSQVYQDKISNKLLRSYEHRMFLTQNADEIMQLNANNAYMTNRCGPCVEPYDQGTMVPEYEKQTCDKNSCTFNVSDAYGLGLGRNFYTNGRNDEYHAKFLAEKEKENAFFKSNTQCCGTVSDFMQYYPIGGPAPEIGRYNVPSGAEPLSGGSL